MSSKSHEATLTRLFDDLARGNTRAAFRTKRNGKWEDASFADWRKRSRGLAALLVDLGIAQGDRVAVFGTTREEWIVADVAILYSGAITVPVYGSLIGDQAAYILDHAEVRVLFAEDAAYVKRVLDASPESIARIEHVILFSGDASTLPADVAKKCRTWKDALAREAKPDDEKIVDERLAAQEPGGLATIVYTSGTTGPPKGAMLTHGVLTFVSVGWVADLMSLEPEDVGIHAAPLTHGAGFHALALTMKGATQVLLRPPRFEPENFCAAVQRHRVTNAWLVPTQIKMLLNYEGLEKWDLSSLKWIAYGGSPMYVEDLKEALRRIGPVFVQLY
ncbi:MAG TPA: AMP-binding protein, partial [Polyangiaceae bacterium]